MYNGWSPVLQKTWPFWDVHYEVSFVAPLFGITWVTGVWECTPYFTIFQWIIIIPNFTIQMDYHSNGLSFQWIIIPMDHHSNGLSFEWVIIPMGYHSNGLLLFQWIIIPMDYHSNGLLFQWIIIPMDYHSNGLLFQWIIIPMDYHSNGYHVFRGFCFVGLPLFSDKPRSPHLAGEIPTGFQGFRGLREPWNVEDLQTLRIGSAAVWCPNMRGWLAEHFSRIGSEKCRDSKFFKFIMRNHRLPLKQIGTLREILPHCQSHIHQPVSLSTWFLKNGGTVPLTRCIAKGFTKNCTFRRKSQTRFIET